MTATDDLGKLPLELRKEIYAHLLVEPRAIAIKRYMHAGNRKNREVARMGNHRDPKHHGQVHDKRAGIWRSAPPGTTSILFVSKTISQEAALVLYGCNGFIFDSARALEDFLVWIGDSKQHLRHVAVNDNVTLNGSWHVMNRALSHLTESAKRLRRLEFSHLSFCGQHDRHSHDVLIERLAQHCKPLLQSLQATSEAQDFRMDVLDVVRIILPPCHCQLCENAKKRCSFPTCKNGSPHGHDVHRAIATRSESKTGDSLRYCYSLCRSADAYNKQLETYLRNEIAKHFGLNVDYE